ncbi:MAG: thiamine diphosphokinase [Clostridiales bacterium]|jgi:thiamine pyrophosphokinase|nr:thiamine diphosphokinase [Clostridiales bacterium]
MRVKSKLTALLLCGGRVADYEECKKLLPKYEYVLCADSGARHLEKLGLKANFFMGDFDSVDPDLYKSLKSDKSVEMTEFDPEKDLTDSEIITQKALKLGCDTLFYIGAWGTRMDHSMANIMLTGEKAQLGINCVMTDGKNTFYFVKDRICFNKDFKGKMISIIPFTPVVKGVTAKGFYYPLFNKDMYKGSTYGVSNYMTDDNASIAITGGLAIVGVCSEDN